MSGELPMACSLGAGALGDRLDELAAVGRSALRSVRRHGARAELGFAAEAREALEAIVAAEAACCPFLDLRVAAVDGGVTLTVEGPVDAAPVVDEFAQAIAAGHERLYALLDADGRYESPVKGELGGNRSTKIYGRLDCRGAARVIARGGYVRNRVFFADERTAKAAGYRPCHDCMPAEYAAWRAGR